MQNFSKSTRVSDLVSGFAPGFSPKYGNVDFQQRPIDLNKGKQVNYGNYYGIGDLPGKYERASINSFQPDEVAINSAINEANLQNYIMGKEAELNELGLRSFGIKQANDEYAREARAQAREKAQDQMRRSGWNLFGTIASTAASFIPGVGPFASLGIKAGTSAIANS